MRYCPQILINWLSPPSYRLMEFIYKKGLYEPGKLMHAYVYWILAIYKLGWTLCAFTSRGFSRPLNRVNVTARQGASQLTGFNPFRTGPHSFSLQCPSAYRSLETAFSFSLNIVGGALQRSITSGKKNSTHILDISSRTLPVIDLSLIRWNILNGTTCVSRGRETKPRQGHKAPKLGRSQKPPYRPTWAVTSRIAICMLRAPLNFFCQAHDPHPRAATNFLID